MERKPDEAEVSRGGRNPNPSKPDLMRYNDSEGVEGGQLVDLSKHGGACVWK